MQACIHGTVCGDSSLVVQEKGAGVWHLQSGKQQEQGIGNKVIKREYNEYIEFKEQGEQAAISAASSLWKTKFIVCNEY